MASLYSGLKILTRYAVHVLNSSSYYMCVQIALMLSESTKIVILYTFLSCLYVHQMRKMKITHFQKVN